MMKETNQIRIGVAWVVLQSQRTNCHLNTMKRNINGDDVVIHSLWIMSHIVPWEHVLYFCYIILLITKCFPWGHERPAIFEIIIYIHICAIHYLCDFSWSYFHQILYVCILNKMIKVALLYLHQFHFLPFQEQFSMLYTGAEMYLREFSNYGNFQWATNSYACSKVLLDAWEWKIVMHLEKCN